MSVASPTTPMKMLSYGSVVIDANDILLFREGNWLNDRLITFASEYLMDQLLPEERHNIELVCGATCELLKFSPDVGSFLADYADKSVIFFIVNNNTDPTRPGGTHWSLLVYVKEQHRFAYLDSLYNADTSAAEAIMMSAARHVCPTVTRPRLLVLPCPKQENSNDCGVLVIEFIRYILHHGRRTPWKALELLGVTKMDAAYIRECRVNWHLLVMELRKRKQKDAGRTITTV